MPKRLLYHALGTFLHFLILRKSQPVEDNPTFIINTVNMVFGWFMSLELHPLSIFVYLSYTILILAI